MVEIDKKLEVGEKVVEVEKGRKAAAIYCRCHCSRTTAHSDYIESAAGSSSLAMADAYPVSDTSAAHS